MKSRSQLRIPPTGASLAAGATISLFHSFQIECVVGDIKEQRDVAAVVASEESGTCPQPTSPGLPLVLPYPNATQDTSSPPERRFADWYREVLLLADGRGVDSLALPALGTRIFRLPLLLGTEIGCRAILETVPPLRSLTRIRLVFSSARSSRLASSVLFQLIRERRGEPGMQPVVEQSSGLNRADHSPKTS